MSSTRPRNLSDHSSASNYPNHPKKLRRRSSGFTRRTSAFLIALAICASVTSVFFYNRARAAINRSFAGPDYTVTTTLNAIVVTDVSGNPDTLTVAEPAAGSITFAALGRSFSVDGGALISGDSGSLPLTGIDSITVNQGNGDDTADFSAFAASLPSLTVNGDAGDDTVNFNGNITFLADANLDGDLQNDVAPPGTDAVNFAGGANVLLSGLGTATIKVSKNIVFGAGSVLEVVNGDLTLEANQQLSATTGDFNGVDILSGTVESNGSGNLNVEGMGGAGDFTDNYGVQITSGGKVEATGAGTINVHGTGGAGSGGATAGNSNLGLYITGAGSTIISSSSTMQVTGQGGTTNDSGVYGVVLDDFGAIETAGAGALTIDATGGLVTGGGPTFVNSAGIFIISGATGNGGLVTSSGTGANAGAIVINGTANPGGNSAAQGVRVDAPGAVTTVDGPITITGTAAACGNACLGTSIRGNVTATGVGAISITGTGAASTGAFPTHGVNVRNGAVVSSFNGDITITGTGGDGTDNAGFNLASIGPGRLQTTGTGAIIVNADIIAIRPAPGLFATIDAGANAVTLRQKTNDVAIDLGSTLDSTANTLELSDLELDRVFAGTLNIGNASSGAETVSAPITRTTATILNLTSGGGINLAASSLDSGGGSVKLTPSTSASVAPTASGTDVSMSTTGTLSFVSGADLAIVINGPTVDTDYRQLSVVAQVDLTGVDLVLSGSHTPVAGETFIVVNNDDTEAITGMFNGLPEGATITDFLGSGLNATITYLCGDGNDAMLTVVAAETPPQLLLVTKTADTDDTCLPGDCSLREAIKAANLDPDLNAIYFDIPTSDPGQFYYADNSAPGVSEASITALTVPGTVDPDWPHSWWRIAPGSALPDIINQVVIDGYSQRPCLAPNPSPCSQENTEVTGDNAILLIELSGSNLGGGLLPNLDRQTVQSADDGLVVTDAAAFSTIMGLVINQFAGSGIVLLGGGGNTLRGNFIGTDVSGTLASDFSFGNGVGIRIEDSGGNQVGCEEAEERNIISGNVGDGVQIVGVDAIFNLIQGNLIGPGRDGSVIGNGGAGVEIYDATDNLIGGFPGPVLIESNGYEKAAPDPNVPQVSSPPGNVIAGNGADGVAVTNGTVTAAAYNIISQNSIFDNEGLGIDLNDDGVTTNDNCDLDDGSNLLQNFPVVTSAVTNGGITTIEFTLDSLVDEEFTIEFYTNTTVDPSGNGEGKTFIESTTVVLDAGCTKTFSFDTTNPLTPGLFVTATATDYFGNTSEFGPNLQVASPTAADSTVSGHIVDVQSVPIAGVVIKLGGTQNRKTITDANGNYRFDEVETSGFYTVRPSRANYSFNPAERSFSQLGNSTDAAFTGSPMASAVHAIDTPEYFVRQHYLDFLSREPDEPGFNFWSDQMLGCGADAGCLESRRISVSAAYFLSIEFQQTGGLVAGLYRASYGVRPQFGTFMPDTRTIAQDVIVGKDGWQEKLAANKREFIDAFVNRAAFRAAFDSLSNDTYVDTLITHTGVAFSTGERAALVDGLNAGVLTRARALQRIADNQEFVNARRNETFVMMQYFGYLRRDPDESGYQFWLNKLDQFKGNFERAEMVKAFITSGEYRQRFQR